MLVVPRNSLIAEVAECLRQGIATGEFGEFLPNVRSLSRDLNVSIPTVLEAVKILAGEGGVVVRQGCPTRVVAPFPPRTVVPRKGEKTVVFLGFSSEDVEKSVFYREAADRLRRSGFAIELKQYTHKMDRLSATEFEKTVARYQADCWVLVGGPPAVQKLFAAHKLPCLVESGIALEGLALPDFEIDFPALYRHAAHQFLNLGHRRIGMVIGRRSAEKNPASLEAFAAAVRERYPEETSAQAVILTHDGSPAHLKARLAELFARPEPPTGLLVAFVSGLVTVQSWLLARGYRIPRDVSLICRDSDETMECLDPVPAYYQHSAKQAIRRLVRAITGIVEQLPMPSHFTVMPEFVKGETLGRAGAINTG